MAIPLHEVPAPSNPDFFDGESSLPSFTTAIRGYQKEEVHAYLRELRHEHSDESRDRQRLEREAQELRQRVATLERAIASTTPNTIDALGERMLLILHHAEAAAADAISSAESYARTVRQEASSRAESHVRQASLRASQAAQALSAARAEAQRHMEETQAEVNSRREAELGEAERIAAQVVATARLKAEGLVTEATTAAEKLVTHAQNHAAALVAEATTKAEGIARQAAEADELAREQMAEREALAYAHLDALADQRDELLAEMGHIHAALARTLRASGFDSGEGFEPSEGDDSDADSADFVSASEQDVWDSHGEAADEDRDPTHEQPVVD